MNKEIGVTGGQVTYIDLFKSGNTVGIQNEQGRVQTGIEVIQKLESCGDIIGMSYDEENLQIIFRYNNNIALKVYGEQALEAFWKLINEYPEFAQRYREQVQKLNTQDTKNKLKETARRVKRQNKHTRKVARMGFAAVCSVVIGASTISFFTKNRNEGAMDKTDINTTEEYELPVTTIDEELGERIKDGSIAFPNINLPMEEDCIKLEYEDRSYTSKAVLCKENYYDKITKYAKMYGIDPQIMLGIATQERGTHSNVEDDSGAIGLMQLECGVWDNPDNAGAVLKAYNFQTHEYDSVEVPLPDMGNLDNNIRYACMNFQACLNQMNNNPIAAIQSYNMGTSNVNYILANYYATTGITREQALADFNNMEWLEYRNCVNEGDPLYVENVLSWLGKEKEFNVTTPNGEKINFKVKACEKNKKLY